MLVHFSRRALLLKQVASVSTKHVEQRKGYAYHVRENPETGKPGVAPPAPLKALDLKLRLEVPLPLDVPALEHAENGRRDARVEGVRGQKKNLKQPRARALPREERRALGTAFAPTAFAQDGEILYANEVTR